MQLDGLDRRLLLASFGAWRSLVPAAVLTHSMRQALDFGGRIIRLHQGKVILDISGAERASVTLNNLLDLFRRKEGKDLADDQLLLG